MVARVGAAPTGNRKQAVSAVEAEYAAHGSTLNRQRQQRQSRSSPQQLNEVSLS